MNKLDKGVSRNTLRAKGYSVAQAEMYAMFFHKKHVVIVPRSVFPEKRLRDDIGMMADGFVSKSARERPASGGKRTAVYKGHARESVSQAKSPELDATPGNG